MFLCFAESVRQTAVQNMEMSETQFALQTVVAGKSRIVPISDVSKAAIFPLSCKSRSAGSGTRCNTRRNEGAESVRNQPCQCRICIHGLEITDFAVTDIARLENELARYLLLYA